MKKELTTFCLALCALSLWGQVATPPSIDSFKDGIHHWNLEHKERNYLRYDSEKEYVEIANNLLGYQNSDGGWPKNVDWLAILPVDSVKSALKERYKESTLDNRNSFPQIKYLAQVYQITRKEPYKQGVIQGLNYLLKTQNKSGGWRGWDVDGITFNDEVTTGALELFLAIKLGDRDFSWLDDNLKRRIGQAYERGLAAILKCQIVQNGVKTAWGQQHDHKTFLPIKARSYELPAITARESCDVLSLLMNIPHPTIEVVEAVQAAIAWLQQSEIGGLRVERTPLEADEIINHEYPYDNVEVADVTAKPIWARYYEVSDNTPFMSTRAGEKVWRLADVNAERRTGYEWYGYWPEAIYKQYEEWLPRAEQALRYRGYETQNDMPLFYQEMKQALTYPMAWGNSDIKKFAKWRKEARKVLLESMQPAPPLTKAYHMECLATEQREGYRAEKILFNVSDYSRVPAYLLVPDGEGPFPAVLLLHDHGARFSIGKEKMVRPFQVAQSVTDDVTDWVERCYDNQFVGDYLASQGYVVLVLDALFWGERGRLEGVRYDSQQALAANMMQMGMSWGALIAWDDIRSAEFLAQLPAVDKEKIGAMGFSMGAHRAWMTAAATDVVKATAAVCWMNTTEHLMTLTNNQNKGGSAYAMLIPGLRNQLDYPHVASIACPKPMLLINGKKDKLFPVEGVNDAFNIMHHVWKSQGAEEALVTTWYDLPHFCSKEIQLQLLQFFNQHIK